MRRGGMRKTSPSLIRSGPSSDQRGVLVRVTDLRVQRNRDRHANPFECQSALEWDPVSAPKRDVRGRVLVQIDDSGRDFFSLKQLRMRPS